MRIPPLARLEQFFDAGSLELLPEPVSGEGLAVTAGVGTVRGRPVVSYAQDSSVAGGSVGTAEAALVVQALRLSGRRAVPLVAFLESAGARLQEGVAALGGFGRIFTENVALTGVVPQVSVITGTSAGGGCYSPALTDFVVMASGASMFLTGPKVVDEVLGEHVSTAELGGPAVHERNGVCHFVAADDADAVAVARDLLQYLPTCAGGPLLRAPAGRPQATDPGAAVPGDPRRAYDVRGVIAAIVDDGRLLESAGRWARNIVTGFARIDGHPVAIVANQPRHLAGVIDVDASQKAAWFVHRCDAYGVPLLVLVDTPGFMPGCRQEAAGVIRHGAALVRAFVTARVPRCTVILRKAYGGAYIAMNSKELGADACLAWPAAEIGVMGPVPAVQILHRRRLEAARSDTLVGQLAQRYASEQLSPGAALRHGLLDAVIDPAETRARVAEAIVVGRSSGRRNGRSTSWASTRAISCASASG